MFVKIGLVRLSRDNTRDRAESYEGIVRQLLKAQEGIAVILLGMVSKSGASAQEWHGKVAAHYGVPFVSYRDALYPFVKDGSISWSDISPDSVHPNDIGHAYAAALLSWTLDGAIADGWTADAPSRLWRNGFTSVQVR